MPRRDPGGAEVPKIGNLRPSADQGRRGGGRHRLSEKPGPSPLREAEARKK